MFDIHLLFIFGSWNFEKENIGKASGKIAFIVVYQNVSMFKKERKNVNKCIKHSNHISYSLIDSYFTQNICCLGNESQHIYDYLFTQRWKVIPYCSYESFENIDK